MQKGFKPILKAGWFVIFFVLVGEAYAQQLLSIGRTVHLGQYITTTPVYPTGKTAENIVAVARDKNDKRIFTFYDDRDVCVGNIDDLTANHCHYYTLPTGLNPDKLLGVAFTDKEFESISWYSNQTFYVGNHYDLDAFAAAQPFTLPSRLSVSDIIGMGIHPYTGQIHTWYKNGQFSIGTPSDLDFYQRPEPYVIEQGYGSVQGLAFYGGDGSVFALHKNEVIHRISFTLGESNWLDSGYVGVQHAELPFGFTQDQVFGVSAQKINHQERIIIWYSSGYYSIGTFDDLDAYGLIPFYDDMDEYEDGEVLDVAVTNDGMVYVYLRYGAVELCEIQDLGACYGHQFSPAEGEIIGAIIGVGASHNYLHPYEPISAWYNDNQGKRPIQTSVGYPDDLDELTPKYSGGLAPNKSSSDVLGVGLIQPGFTVTYYRLY